MMVPPMQPTLSDALVDIRPMVSNDWNALYAVAADREIWAIHPAHDRWQETVFREFFDEALASNGAVTVRDGATGAVIGSSRYDTRVCQPGEVEIGWTFLARAAWGGAINRSLKQLMIGYAFAKGFDQVIFLVGETNGRSRRAMEKIGAVLTERRQIWTMADAQVNHLIYAITPESFATGALAAA